MRWLRVRVGVAALAAVLTVTGCGGNGRSTQAFCDRLASEKAQYLQKYNQRATQIKAAHGALEGLLIGLGSSFEAIGDTIIIFDKLAKVAPDEIQSDVEAIRVSLKQQRDAVGKNVTNPMAGIASSLASGLTTMGSWRRVEQFISANCH